MRQAAAEEAAEAEVAPDEDAAVGLPKSQGTAVARPRSLDPDPDGFVEKSNRLPKGHARATAIAEAVLLDRVRELLDRHYDGVFTTEWLEAHAAATTAQLGEDRSRATASQLAPGEEASKGNMSLMGPFQISNPYPLSVL